VTGSFFSSYRRSLAFLLLGALFAACSVLGRFTPSGAPQATPTPEDVETLVVTTATATALPPELVPIWTSTPTQTGGDARETITTAMRKVRQAGPFHIHSLTTTEDGKNIVLDGDVILPDRFHITSVEAEILIVANQTYSKQNGRWVDLKMDSGSLVSELIGSLSDQAIAGINRAMLAHPETMDGIPTHEYKYQSNLNLSGEKYVSDNQIWISDSSGLPVHLETSGIIAGVQATTVQEITYNPSIQIEAPGAP
jgi:hypothetical protein